MNNPLLSPIENEKRFAIYKTVALWDQNNLDHPNSTGFSIMFKENPGIKGARQITMNWWEKFITKPYGFKKTEGPSLVDIGHELVKLECTFYEWETWCLTWFSHYTYNIHLSDNELLKSFSHFVDRKLPLQHNLDTPSRHRAPGSKTYCLMGANDRWRWKGPCRCEHCRKFGIVRIDH